MIAHRLDYKEKRQTESVEAFAAYEEWNNRQEYITVLHGPEGYYVAHMFWNAEEREYEMIGGQPENYTDERIAAMVARMGAHDKGISYVARS